MENQSRITKYNFTRFIRELILTGSVHLLDICSRCSQICSKAFQFPPDVLPARPHLHQIKRPPGGGFLFGGDGGN